MLAGRAAVEKKTIYSEGERSGAAAGEYNELLSSTNTHQQFTLERRSTEHRTHPGPLSQKIS